jgi:hypothetical protein
MNPQFVKRMKCMKRIALAWHGSAPRGGTHDQSNERGR